MNASKEKANQVKTGSSRAGARRYEVTAKAGYFIVFLALAAFSARSPRLAHGDESDAASDGGLEQVVVVFKTHFDIGYTDLPRRVVDRYRTSMIDKALEVCEHTRALPPEHRFVWTVPGWPMAQILWPGQTPERRERIVQAIRDGRLVWHALPATTHTESLDLEDLVRGLRFSSELSRSLGLPLPRDAKMTDVPSHCWILPTIRRSANHEIFCLAGGLAATGPDGIGVGLCPVDAPLISLGHRGLLRYSREFGTRKPLVFVNLYNNVWGTNFQQWIGGSWSARVRLWAVDGNGARNDLVSRSWDARSRTKVAVFDGPAGTLAPSQAGVELSRPGVLITAFGANPDGDGQVLRLWEQVGQSGPCRVRLPVGLRTAQVQPCDLRGRARGKPIPVDDGWFEVPLTRFAPASVLLRNERKTRND